MRPFKLGMINLVISAFIIKKLIPILIFETLFTLVDLLFKSMDRFSYNIGHIRMY